MHCCFVAVGEYSGRFDYKVDTQGTPWQSLWITLSENLQNFPINADSTFDGFNSVRQDSED